jgi:exodeoxyribonuclease VII small subunit
MLAADACSLTFASPSPTISLMAKHAGSDNNENPKDPSFEQSLEALESLVKKLEAPETPLDQIIASFSEGQKLLKICQKRLKDAELILEKAGEDGKTEKI